ncbi:MAG TPA: Ppx/GppA phosphatase family protein [Streptosporangiaceae bacterium]|nr:Ppx/GppA phosphatase family protein [Streptosporangiaceae bacterium]
MTSSHATSSYATSSRATSSRATEKGTRRVAAIDCGTNSLRLLIADLYPESARLVDLHRRMEIVRLGQGVDATGRLAPEALERTFRVLTEYATTITDSGARSIRMVATSASRDASNADDFSSGVRRILGINPEVITGAQEAQLSFSGATAELAADPSSEGGRVSSEGGRASSGGGRVASDGGPDVAHHGASRPGRPQPPFLVVDIGGGSTEFVVGSPIVASLESATDSQATPKLSAISMDIGCVRLTERHLRTDPPTAEQVAAATADIDEALAKAAQAVPASEANTLVGLAGSVTTLTAIALELPAYDPDMVHHARISADRVHEVTKLLLSQTRDDRAANPVIHPGRVDVIGAGALIADRVMTKFGFSELVASEHDILDGIAWSMVTGAGRRSAS